MRRRTNLRQSKPHLARGRRRMRRHYHPVSKQAGGSWRSEGSAALCNLGAPRLAGRCRLCAQLAIDLEVEVLSWAGYGERLVHRRSRFLRVHSAYNHRRIISLAEASRPFTATWVLPRTRPAPFRRLVMWAAISTSRAAESSMRHATCQLAHVRTIGASAIDAFALLAPAHSKSHFASPLRIDSNSRRRFAPVFG